MNRHSYLHSIVVSVASCTVCSPVTSGLTGIEPEPSCDPGGAGLFVSQGEMVKVNP